MHPFAEVKGRGALEKPGNLHNLSNTFSCVTLLALGGLFKIHENSPPLCPVGGNIHTLLASHFYDAQLAMENSLAEVSLETLYQELKEILK